MVPLNVSDHSSHLRRILGGACSELPGPLTSRQVQVLLMERGFLVRDCSNYPGLHERMLRFAVRTSRENAQLVKHVQHVVQAQP